MRSSRDQIKSGLLRLFNEKIMIKKTSYITLDEEKSAGGHRVSLTGHGLRGQRSPPRHGRLHIGTGGTEHLQRIAAWERPSCTRRDSDVIKKAAEHVSAEITFSKKVKGSFFLLGSRHIALERIVFVRSLSGTRVIKHHKKYSKKAQLM